MIFTRLNSGALCLYRIILWQGNTFLWKDCLVFSHFLISFLSSNCDFCDCLDMYALETFCSALLVYYHLHESVQLLI